MRRIQLLTACAGILLTASAGLAWRRNRAPQPPPAAKTTKHFNFAADSALMRTPSNQGIPPVANLITIATLDRQTQPSRPVSISRFFAPSEISPGQFATAVIAGQPVPTQCDIRTRWPDGSLQHAVLTFKSSVTPSPTVVAFAPAPDSLASPGLDAGAMLSDRFDFSAILEIETPDGRQRASARDMVKAGLFRYWSRGPLMTQIIIEELGPQPANDFLANGHRSIHPIFIATFYEGHRGVRVEVVSEIAWRDRLQRVIYSARILTGPPGQEQPAYEIANFSHLARTRWRRDLWSGPPLARVHVNHNLPYMVYSRILPSFDLSRSVSKSAVEHELAYQKQRDNFRGMGPANCSRPGGSCAWFTGFGSTGGRPELGLIPRWDVRYLYTFDPRLYDAVIANADVSGHVPIHDRESASGRVFHHSADKPADANGRIVSIDARSCFVSREFGETSCAKDAPVYVGSRTRGPWEPDLAHQGSFAFVAYLLTGDWYFLEELYFWAGWNMAWANNGNCDYCRGGNDANSGVYGVVNAWVNIRGVAWGLRAIAQAAILAPDGSPEKGYFREKVLNNIAAAEGRFSIKDGVTAASPLRQPVWRHGFRDLGFSMVNPFYSWWPAVGKGPPGSHMALDPATCANWTTAPMQNFNYVMFGYIDELGFPATTLRRTMLRSILNQLANPDYNPYLIDETAICSGPSNRVFHKDWAGVLSGFKPSVQKRKSFTSETIGETELGYGYVALAAASFMSDVEEGPMNGRAAHKWLAENYPALDALNANPKWALVPRPYAFKGSVSAPATWHSGFRALAAMGTAGSAKDR
ncbi:MAG: hypothetical protein IH602_05540 [Bryobacteraceae bacterium]|nr:hypothetical protein [Bryobacteraceae bacterium]